MSMPPPDPLDVRFTPLPKAMKKGLPILFWQLFWSIFCPNGSRRWGENFGQPGSLPVVIYSLAQAGKPLLRALYYLLETLVLVLLLLTCLLWFPAWVWLQRRQVKREIEQVNAVMDEISGEQANGQK